MVIKFGCLGRVELGCRTYTLSECIIWIRMMREGSETYVVVLYVDFRREACFFCAEPLFVASSEEMLDVCFWAVWVQLKDAVSQRAGTFLRKSLPQLIQLNGEVCERIPWGLIILRCHLGADVRIVLFSAVCICPLLDGLAGQPRDTHRSLFPSQSDFAMIRTRAKKKNPDTELDLLQTYEAWWLRTGLRCIKH